MAEEIVINLPLKAEDRKKKEDMPYSLLKILSYISGVAYNKYSPEFVLPSTYYIYNLYSPSTYYIYNL